MSSFARQRADRIRKEIPILQLLYDYGYQVDPGVDREQQFACDLHGDGMDRKFSARVYPYSQQWYCWACQISRDAIATVRAKEDLTFGQACRRLEKLFNLPPLVNNEPRPENIEESLQKAFSSPEDFELSAKALASTLGTLTRERWFSMSRTLSFWEVYDKICFLVKDPYHDMGEMQGLKALSKLRGKLELAIQNEQRKSWPSTTV